MYPIITDDMIHGPSLGLGAGVLAIAIIASFLVFGANITMDTEQKLQIQPTPTVEEPEFSKVFLLDNGSPVLGDPNASVTIVEFGDYQCHYCNVFFHNTEHAIIKDYVDTGKVNMIFKDFTIIGPDSINAAHAAHCADDQGKFWEYHDTLYNNWTGENNGWASSQNLLEFAKTVELDTDEFTECMLDARHANIIQNSNSDGQALGLRGTPAFFVIGPDDNITMIGGAQPYDVFARILDSELEK